MAACRMTCRKSAWKQCACGCKDNHSCNAGSQQPQELVPFALTMFNQIRWLLLRRNRIERDLVTAIFAATPESSKSCAGLTQKEVRPHKTWATVSCKTVRRIYWANVCLLSIRVRSRNWEARLQMRREPLVRPSLGGCQGSRPSSIWV